MDSLTADVLVPAAGRTPPSTPDDDPRARLCRAAVRATRAAFGGVAVHGADGWRVARWHGPRREGMDAVIPRLCVDIAHRTGAWAIEGVDGWSVAGVAMDGGRACLLVADGMGRAWQADDLEALDDVAALAPARADGDGRGSERRAARDAQARFRTMADHAPVLIWVVDQEGCGEFFNRAWLEFTGRALEQETGAGWTAGLHPDDRDAFLAAHRAHFDARRPFRTEFRLRRADGEYRWLLDHGAPRVGTDGHFAGFVGSCVDITDRREAEEALLGAKRELERHVRERTAALAAAVVTLERQITIGERSEQALRRSEALFRALIEHASDITVVLAGDGSIRYQSPSIERILGWSPERVAGLPALDFVHPDDQAEASVALAALLNAPGEVVSMERRIRHADGRWRQMELVARNLLADPAVHGIVVNARDVTERRDAEAARLRAEVHFRQLAENVRDVFWVATAGRDTPCVHFATPAFAEIWGIPVERLYADAGAWFNAVHPDDRVRVREALDAQAYAAYAEEYRIVRPDGSVRWIRDRAFPIHEPDGTVLRVCGIAEDVTERRESEDALRDSEERFRAVVESLGEGLLITGPDDVVLYANGRVGQLTGHAPAGLRDRPVREVLEMEAPARAHGVARDERYEARVRHRDGHTVWVEVFASPFRDGGGRVAGTVRALADVSERKRAEAALRQSEADYRGLFENAHDAILILSPDDERVLDVNPRACDLYGYAREEFLSMSMRQVSVDVTRGRAKLRETLDTGVVRNFMLAQRRRDGRLLRVEVTAAVVEYRGRKAVLSINRDVTERWEAERAVRESEAQFRAIFAAAGAGIALLDGGGNVVESNAALQDMLGRSAAELHGAALAAVAGGDGDDDADGFRALMAGGTGYQAERLLTHADGSPVWAHVTVTAVRDEQGGPAYAIAIVENVTERREAEKALLESQERLRLGQRIEAVGRLAGGVAHDFNNLLMAVMAHLYVLRGDPGIPEGRRWNVDEIHRAAERAASLTQQLLAFSRRQVLEPRVLDLNEVVGGVERLLRRLIGEDVRMVIRLAPALGRVEADPGQMEQVIMNLVVNARDALPNGGRIHVATSDAVLTEGDLVRYPYAQPGPYVVLSVRDEGAGMDEATLSRIFDPFFTTKEQGKGTGLGLSTVYGIVKQSGGYVWVDSRPGEGSTFQVYLPRVEGEPAPAPPPTPPHVPRGGETVLLVEDEATLRQVIGDLLRTCGYTVLEAADGDAALRTAAACPGPVHLLLTDVVMPGMAGPELVRRLAPLRPGLRVLYMSGYPGEAVAGHGAGEAGFVQKPVRPDVLARRVREALDAPVGAG